MTHFSRLAAAISRFFEATAKARVNSTLLLMGRERVEALGYSWESLVQGPNQWPWRDEDDQYFEEIEIRTSVGDLDGLPEQPINDPDKPKADEAAVESKHEQTAA